MTYGCIGEHLKHSFSKEIHALIADYDYEIREIPRDGVDAFMREHSFAAINVTIPYKETVIPYLDFIDESAKLIGAVNTIVNRGGKLYGYNTDFFGLSALAKRTGIDFSGKKVLILGTGGTSKTAEAVARAEGAREIVKASRNASNGAVLYTDVYKYHTDAEIIINTTPVGMFPNISGKPIELSAFGRLEGVLDAIYNPMRTPLILEALFRGIPASGGLYMLVAQGVRASEHFTKKTYDESVCERVFKKISADKTNAVLIGMPASGKSTVGAILAERLSRPLLDTDKIIVEKSGMPIPEIFKQHGEAHFRDLESEAVESVAPISGAVIATGGGAVLRGMNVDALRKNGRIYFIDRPLDALIPTADRPTASTVSDIEKRYHERYEIYRSAADVIINADTTIDKVAEAILSDLLG
ncbi:MAG: shikimate dehydrogenase [Ruminococcaceae bacterium]|nr:shikimate dehydrogenase [Oscillospiraceae bacterium]